MKHSRPATPRRLRRFPSSGAFGCMLVSALLLCGPASSAHGMEPLDESELQSVTARDGIALGLDLRANADFEGGPLGSDCSNNPMAATECRLGIQIGSDEQEWLVLKGFYGAIRIPGLQLDVTSTASEGTVHEDLSRFEDEQEQALLDSPHGGTTLQLVVAEDIEIPGFTVSGISLEYDAAEEKGFRRHEAGSLMGLEVGSSLQSKPAGITVQGRALIYGF